MWNDEERQRFTELRRSEETSTLSESKRIELTALTAEILALESAYLSPVIQRLRRRREVDESKNLQLRALAERKAALVQRLQSDLGEAEVSRRESANRQQG